MRRLFLILILALAPVGLAAQEAEPTKAELLVADSQNAHDMATVALEAVACLLSDMPEQACMARFEPLYMSLGQEHQFIHKKLQALSARRQS